MNKSEFIDAVAEKAELTRAAAARVVDAIFDTAGGAVRNWMGPLGAWVARWKRSNTWRTREHSRGN